MTTKNNSSKKEPPQSVKGMRDIIGEEWYAQEGFIEKASEIAIYYGFRPIETPVLEHEELFRSSVGENTDIVEKEMYSLRTRGGDHLVLRPEGTAPIMRAYLEHGMQSLPQPVSLFYRSSLFRHESPQRGRYRQHTQFGIEVIGSPKSIADAEVIHIIHTIVRESGIENVIFDINSIGDQECRPRFIRELTNYYKKHIADVCTDCKRRVKENPLRLLDCKDKKCQPIKENAPQSLTSLCDACRKHFKEVLEYLEALKIPYRINNYLVRGIDYYTRTVFEVAEDAAPSEEDVRNIGEKEGDSPENASADVSKAKNGKDKDGKNSESHTEERVGLSLGGGGRYDYLARHLGHRKDTPAVGGGIGVDRILLTKGFKRNNPRIVRDPKIFFIQLGFEAKLKSLGIIEIIRKAKIPLTQSLAKDSLSSQLQLAEKLRAPYAIIFGQKEAIDDSVIVRNMATRSQDTVPIKELSKYVKGMK